MFEAHAVWTGLEPATSAVTGRHSNQLNYQTNLYNPLQDYLSLFLFMVGTGIEHVSSS